MSDLGQLAAIHQRAEQATKGPWYPYHSFAFHSVSTWAAPPTISAAEAICEVDSHANAEFIAHARQDIPYLLSLVGHEDELRRKVDAREEHIRQLLTERDDHPAVQQLQRIAVAQGLTEASDVAILQEFARMRADLDVYENAEMRLIPNGDDNLVGFCEHLLALLSPLHEEHRRLTEELAALQTAQEALKEELANVWATEPPLFIPLKAEFFEAFQAGTKTEELRRYGPRWNERTCRVGRAVVLSRGYGRQARLQGRIWRFKKQHGSIFGSTYRASIERLYGTLDIDIACISIDFSKEPAAVLLPRWQPIESAPKDFTPVLLLWHPPQPPNAKPTVILERWYCRTHALAARHHDCPNEADCRMGWGSYAGEMSHWMSLPEPPTP